MHWFAILMFILSDSCFVVGSLMQQHCCDLYQTTRGAFAEKRWGLELFVWMKWRDTKGKGNNAHCLWCTKMCVGNHQRGWHKQRDGRAITCAKQACGGHTDLLFIYFYFNTCFCCLFHFVLLYFCCGGKQTDRRARILFFTTTTIVSTCVNNNNEGQACLPYFDPFIARVCCGHTMQSLHWEKRACVSL